ncbi:MAG: hypothetical protein M0C28_41255 [Candidatus Moduliflexus flocculans]|nr:hypothetical protein [Candidatus Moduliflexus flocculans]
MTGKDGLGFPAQPERATWPIVGSQRRPVAGMQISVRDVRLQDTVIVVLDNLPGRVHCRHQSRPRSAPPNGKVMNPQISDSFPQGRHVNRLAFEDQIRVLPMKAHSLIRPKRYRAGRATFGTGPGDRTVGISPEEIRPGNWREIISFISSVSEEDTQNIFPAVVRRLRKGPA